jgi:hypothetical protein
MLMSLSSTKSTVCPGGRSRLIDKSKVRSGTLRNGESEGSSSLEAPPVSWITRSGAIVVDFGVGSRIWSLESSTSAGRMWAANFMATSGDWGRSESPLIMRGLGVIGIGVCVK